jgi:hypothetical protein
VKDSQFKTQDPTMAGRYLAGQLSDEEQQAYEALLVSHPEVLRELEATARLKVGLARLRDRGELDGLLRSSAVIGPMAWLHRPALIAVAASLALAVVGALMWRDTMTRGDMLYASLGALQGHAAASRSLVAHYTLMRTRSANPEVLISPPPPGQALEVRIWPDIPAGAGGYLVQLYRVQADGTPEGRALAGSGVLQPGADAFITVYADSSLLREGRYQFKVSAAGPSAAASPDAAAGPGESFSIRVAAPLSTGKVPPDV